jgi:hypothetical protein
VGPRLWFSRLYLLKLLVYQALRAVTQTRCTAATMASGLCLRLLRPGRSLEWASFLRPSVGLPLDRFADQQFSSQAAAGAAVAAPMEVERDASPAGLPSHLDARLLEALPDWLPLLPGRSYWRPPRPRGMAEPEVDWQRLLLPQGTWYGVPQTEEQGE